MDSERTKIQTYKRLEGMPVDYDNAKHMRIFQGSPFFRRIFVVVVVAEQLNDDDERWC